MSVCNYENEIWALIYDQYNQGRHQHELSFYSEQLDGIRGPVLELACGTGMILLELLKQGHDIYGLDVSEHMLERLSFKASAEGLDTLIDGRTIRHDMKSFQYDMQFDSIIIPARSFLHLTSQDDQIECLRRVHCHLKDGGRLILNFFNPSLSALLNNLELPADFMDTGTYTNPYDENRKIRLYYRQQNHIADQLQYIEWKFVTEDAELLSSMVIRWIYKEEFQLLLKLAGFSNWNLLGGFDGSAFSVDSKEMIWIIMK
ncbi:MAG: class I SAM-dependent methyltransferase [Armatimonadota bacterium]